MTSCFTLQSVSLLSLFLNLLLSTSVSLSQPRAFPFCLSHSLNLVLSPSLCLTSVSFTTSCFPPLSHSQPLAFHFCLSHFCVSLSQPLAFPFCRSHFCLSHSLNLLLFTSVCLTSVSLSLPLAFCFSLSHCLSLLLPPSVCLTSVCLTLSTSCFPLLSVSLSQPFDFPFCLSHFCLSRCLNLVLSTSRGSSLMTRRSSPCWPA